MKELIILVGNIGSGKSTYCSRLVKKNYLIVSKDQMRYAIGAGKYIHNVEYEPSIHQAIKTFCKNIMFYSTANLVIDETNMTNIEREIYLKLANEYHYKKICIIFPNLGKKESVKRRLNSNHGDTAKKIWEEVWENKNKEYQKPSLKEGFDRIKVYE